MMLHFECIILQGQMCCIRPGGAGTNSILYHCVPSTLKQYGVHHRCSGKWGDDPASKVLTMQARGPDDKTDVVGHICNHTPGESGMGIDLRLFWKAVSQIGKLLIQQGTVP